MCLSRLDPAVEEKYGKKIFGWKVFWKDGGKLKGRIQGIKERPKNTWLREDRFRPDRSKTSLQMCVGGTYPTGWHIYLTREAARNNTGRGYGDAIKQVFFRRPVAWGKQWGRSIVVAKEIYIEG